MTARQPLSTEILLTACINFGLLYTMWYLLHKSCCCTSLTDKWNQLLFVFRSKSWCEMSTEFRKLLFKVSEALVTEELSALKFLSLDYVAKGKLEAIHEPKAFFEVLQERDMIGTGNLFFLKELLYRIHRIDLLTAHLSSSREEMEKELQVPGRAQVSDYRYTGACTIQQLGVNCLFCLQFCLVNIPA